VTTTAPDYGTPRNGSNQTLKFSDISTGTADGSAGPGSWTLHREHDDPDVLVHLTIPGEPVSKARARFTNYRSPNRAYTPEKTRQAEETFASAFRKTVPGWKPKASIGFGVMAIFYTESFQRRDIDNMLKLVLDAFNKIIWVDDVQVSEVSGRVVRGDGAPRTEVAIYRAPAYSRPTKPCEHCQKPYPVYTSQSDRRFCSQKCHIAFRRAARRRVCPQCSTEFFPTHKQLHCSRACQDLASRVQVTCVHCGTDFTKPRSLVRHGNNYCGNECQTAYWRDRKTKAAKGSCTVCGGPTSKKSYRRCNPCKRSGRDVPATDLDQMHPGHIGLLNPPTDLPGATT
jgi:Holliday junction resolvase RusA-like endonuclease